MMRNIFKDWWCSVPKLSLAFSLLTADDLSPAAVLFVFATVTALHNAAGSTGNYAGYDEPYPGFNRPCTDEGKDGIQELY